MSADSADTRSAAGQRAGERATEVLRANWRGDHTVPARGLYPHQWSWDSAFIAFGLRHLDPARAQQELLSLLRAQWDDGRLPQIVFNTATTETYFPGPQFWRSTQLPGTPDLPTAGLIQPPNHAWAVWAVHEADPALSQRSGFLRQAYTALLRWHEYLRNRRDRGGRGLICAVHPWETGMDNSPAWDEPLAPVPRAHDVVPERPDLRHADPSERPSDNEYAHYAYLAARYRDHDCDDLDAGFPFLVEDAGMNALWAISERALARIADALGLDPDPHLEAARAIEKSLEHLWDGDLGVYVGHDLVAGRNLRRVTVGGMLPLMLGGPRTGHLLETLRGPRFRLGEVTMVPSYDLTADDVDGAAYWRGPSWFNTTWMVMRALEQLGEAGLADGLRRQMVTQALQHDFPEYVDPWTGEPHGTRSFSWTAALVLDAELASGPVLP